jgi:hypothetical protein
LRAEKLQYFPYPDIVDTRANPNAIGMDKNLSQGVMNLSTTFIAKAHVEFCVGVPKQIHVFWTCPVCKLSDGHLREDPRPQPQDHTHPEEGPRDAQELPSVSQSPPPCSVQFPAPPLVLLETGNP